MKASDLRALIDAYVQDEITASEFELLQEALRESPRARELYREAMDLEAALRTWATADPKPVEVPQPAPLLQGPWRPLVAVAAAACVLFALAMAWHLGQDDRGEPITPTPVAAALGDIRDGRGAVWAEARGPRSGQRLEPGEYALLEGVAELAFASGTDVTLQAPCRIQVEDEARARLLEGNAVVNVGELSDGFLLETPEAVIRDEGTEYAVALAAESTEVHVFDGAVLWSYAGAPEAAEAPERIEAGEARRFSRRGRGRGKRVPLDKFQFIRGLEARLRAEADGALLAYDGFENLAGRMRRGRSGFGWAGGWASGRRGREGSGEIVDAPRDVVFGVEREGRRLLRIAAGRSMRRAFEVPLPLGQGDTVYVSLMLRREETSASTGRSVQIGLGAAARGRGRGATDAVAFGVGTDDLPYVKVGGRITRAGPALPPGATRLFVLKLHRDEAGRLDARLRVFAPGERVGARPPTAWTVVGEAAREDAALEQLRVGIGASGRADVDELRVGTSWSAVTAPQAR